MTLYIIKKYWKSALYTALILHLSFAKPSEFNDFPVLFPDFDKLAHFLMYAGLVAVLIFDLKNDTKHSEYKKLFLFLCVIFPILLGGLIEILQGYFFKPRTADIFDWIFDIVGVAVSIGIYFLFRINQKFIRK